MLESFLDGAIMGANCVGFITVVGSFIGTICVITRLITRR